MRAPWWVTGLWVLLGVIILSVFTLLNDPPAEAQQAPLPERQVRALETIAREMSRMRREKCR